jgi:hypothetical protein
MCERIHLARKPGADEHPLASERRPSTFPSRLPLTAPYHPAPLHSIPGPGWF